MAEPARPGSKKRKTQRRAGAAKSAAKKGGKKASGKGKQKKQAKKTSPAGSQAPVNFEHMKALSHPLRIQILAILAERMASPTEMSKELDEHVTVLAYHVDVLEECGLIVEDHSAPRRGAVEHFYRGTTPTIVPPNAWDNLPPTLRRCVSARILREFFEDASESLEAGAFDGSPGELSWTPLILDEVGVKKLEQLSEDFVKTVLKVQREASNRLRSEKGEARNAASATVFLASFLSARSPAEGRKASATKRR